MLYVSGFVKNLVSVRKIDESGCYICFGAGRCVVEISEGKFMVTGGFRFNDLYYLDVKYDYVYAAEYVVYMVKFFFIYLWYLRFGYLNFQKLVRMYKRKLVNGLNLDILTDFGVCEVCVLGKYYRVSFFTESAERVIRLFGLVYTDVCGLLFIFIGGKLYFISFIDDYFRFTVVYYMRQKSVTFICFKEYKVWAEV